MIRVVLADDHALVRAGLRALVEAMPGITVVGDVEDGRVLVTAIGDHRADIALVNISMRELNGIEATRRVRAKSPRTRVIVVSLHADEEYVRAALAAGASGYVVKRANRDELELAIRAVARGDTWIDPTISQLVVDAFVRGDSATETLTPRQREILQLVAEGRVTKEIATRLQLSIKTVESHRSQLMRKLDCDNVAGLVRAAIRLGVVEPR